MKRTFALAICALLLTAGDALLAGDAHPSWNRGSCMNCHKASEATRIEPRVSRPCAQMCLSCHTKLERHHPVGVKIPRPVQSPLLVTSDGRNTCSTCHDMSRTETDRQIWTSQSFIQRISRRSGEHKTYFLVVRNDRGQLCRNCH